MSKDKERLDVLLVERGLAETRSRAQALILAGRVICDDHRRDKPGDRVSRASELRVKGGDDWASRGAHKLLGALEAFPMLEARIQGARCMDVGASTGGFTDVLLKKGASRVIAVDVGYGQLHHRLASDDRVHVLDRTNIRHLKPDSLPFTPQVVTCDVSFISLERILGVLFRDLEEGGIAILLVKPQFEVGPDKVGRGGVVRDETLRREALQKVSTEAESVGFSILGSAESPLAGPKGNREWLLVTQKVTPQKGAPGV